MSIFNVATAMGLPLRNMITVSQPAIPMPQAIAKTRHWAAPGIGGGRKRFADARAALSAPIAAPRDTSFALAALASALAEAGEFDCAACLLGAAATVRETNYFPLLPAERPGIDRPHDVSRPFRAMISSPNLTARECN
ncbi:hypothetical protein ACGF5S_16970 [Nocardia nova]|uniref:hypothetical protein n=1 Tax=Nocardia nova TaxID=37330 RepID=UPI003712BFCE